MRMKVSGVLFLLISLILFARGTFSVLDFSANRSYEIHYMLDSELHTWVGHDDYVDISKSEFEQLRSVIQRNESYVKSLRQKVSELESQIEDLKDQLSNKEQTIGDLEDRITTLTASVSSLEGLLKEKDQKITELQDRESDLEDRITTLTASVSFLKSLLEEKDQKIAEKDQHILNLKNQIQDLENLLDAKNEEITILASLASAPATITEIFKENKDLKKRLETAESTITILKEEIRKGMNSYLRPKLSWSE